MKKGIFFGRLILTSAAVFLWLSVLVNSTNKDKLPDWLGIYVGFVAMVLLVYLTLGVSLLEDDTDK